MTLTELLQLRSDLISAINALPPFHAERKRLLGKIAETECAIRALSAPPEPPA